MEAVSSSEASKISSSSVTVQDQNTEKCHVEVLKLSLSSEVTVVNNVSVQGTFLCKSL